MSDVQASNVAVTGQNAFVELLASLFSTSSDVALSTYAKLRAHMQSDRQTEALYLSAQAGTYAGDVDDVFEEVAPRVQKWNMQAIIRQVIMPLASGYGAYALAIAAGVTGAVPVLIGFLVGAIIYLAMAPGTLAMLKTKISQTVDDIFKPTNTWF